MDDKKVLTPPCNLQNRREWKLPADNPLLYDQKYEDDRLLAALEEVERNILPLECFGITQEDFRRHRGKI